MHVLDWWSYRWRYNLSRESQCQFWHNLLFLIVARDSSVIGVNIHIFGQSSFHNSTASVHEALKVFGQDNHHFFLFAKLSYCKPMRTSYTTEVDFDWFSGPAASNLVSALPFSLLAFPKKCTPAAPPSPGAIRGAKFPAAVCSGIRPTSASYSPRLPLVHRHKSKLCVNYSNPYR